MEHSSKIQNRKAFLEKLEELKCLNLPSGEYAIIGSGPMAIRGLREANDIDVVVKKTLWLELLKRFVPYDSNHSSADINATFATFSSSNGSNRERILLATFSSN